MSNAAEVVRKSVSKSLQIILCVCVWLLWSGSKVLKC